MRKENNHCMLLFLDTETP